MKNNKKGLSTIVATLLIILLTLVAVGIIWVVVKNVIQGGSDQVDTDTACLQANVVATKVVNTTPLDVTPVNYSVTLSRTGGNEAIGGVKLIFTNNEGSMNFIQDVPATKYPLAQLETKTVPAIGVTVVDANKVNVLVYFLDASGNEQLCQTSNQLVF